MGQALSKRLRTQLMVAFLAITFLLLFGVTAFNYNRAEKVIQEQTAYTIQQYFVQNQYSITDYTKEVEKLLRLLTIQESLHDYLREGWHSKFESIEKANEIFEYTGRMMGNYEYIDSIYYYGNDGTAIGVLLKKNLLTMEPNRKLPYYSLGIQEEMEEDLGEIRWIGGYTSKDFSMEFIESAEEIPYITVVKGIWLGEGRSAVVVINIRQEEFANLFTKSDTSDGRESYLMDMEGKIIVHRDAEQVGKQSDVTMEELAAAGEYLMKGDIQINYHIIPYYEWIIVSNISKESLYGNLTSLKKWYLVFGTAGMAAALALSAYWLNRLTAPLNQLRTAMERMEQGSLGEQLDESSKNELGMLGRQFNRMSLSILTMIDQIKEMEGEKRMLEKEALQGQLNPHFLFNTLSNMRFMARLGKNDLLEKSFSSLGNMLQPMYRSEGELWSLRQELDYMHNYIIIMNCHYGDKLTVQYEIPEELELLPVLKFMLQPLVENAISHGFSETGGEGIIYIRAARKEDCLVMYVEDNGSGIAPEEMVRVQNLLKQAGEKKELHKGNVGISNVHRRLMMHFGKEYGLRIESIYQEKTSVCLVMPVMEPFTISTW